MKTKIEIMTHNQKIALNEASVEFDRIRLAVENLSISDIENGHHLAVAVDITNAFIELRNRIKGSGKN